MPFFAVKKYLWMCIDSPQETRESENKETQEFEKQDKSTDPRQHKPVSCPDLTCSWRKGSGDYWAIILGCALSQQWLRIMALHSNLILLTPHNQINSAKSLFELHLFFTNQTNFSLTLLTCNLPWFPAASSPYPYPVWNVTSYYLAACAWWYAWYHGAWYNYNCLYIAMHTPLDNFMTCPLRDSGKCGITE